MTRFKPVISAPLLRDSSEVDAALADIAALRRETAIIEAEMNAAIDAAKEAARQASAGHRAEIAALETAIARYAESNRDLFTQRKSWELTYGTIGFRSSSKIKPLPKWTWDRVLNALRDADLPLFIRVRMEPDREALKSLAPDRLKELGCRLVQEETFFYEIDEQEVGRE